MNPAVGIIPVVGPTGVRVGHSPGDAAVLAAAARVTVRLRHEKIHAADCERCETREGRIDRIECSVELQGELQPEQCQRLFEIAGRCPVHRTLESEILIETRLAE